MGGLYQITQVYFNGQGALGSSGPEELCASSEAVVDSDSFRALFTILLGAFFSPGVVGVPADAVVGLKSKAVPGVLGVFAADPKDANAPDPSPKAEEPAVVGEAKPVFVKGEIALKGLRPPCDELSPPRRFDAENVRDGGSGLSLWVIDRESLLVLSFRSVLMSHVAGGRGFLYLERRVHKFSLLSIGN